MRGSPFPSLPRSSENEKRSQQCLPLNLNNGSKKQKLNSPSLPSPPQLLMNFTPQQLAGGVRYGSKTLVGNWLEDVKLSECKYSDFQRSRAEGSLVMGKFNEKVAVCTEVVPHTFRSDGTLRYGDSVVVAHKQTGGALACDPFEKAGFEGDEFKASVGEGVESVARNTFVLGKVEGGGEGDEVSVGRGGRGGGDATGGMQLGE